METSSSARARSSVRTNTERRAKGHSPTSKYFYKMNYTDEFSCFDMTFFIVVIESKRTAATRPRSIFFLVYLVYTSKVVLTRDA